MKPFKSGAILASWLLRIMLVWFIYRQYLTTFTGFDLSSFNFYVGAAYILFGLLLFAGGFMQKPGLTVAAGLAIFILPLVQLIRDFPESFTGVLLIYLIPLAVGFYFFTSGNNT